MVLVFQLALAPGARGGAIVDHSGVGSAFVAGAMLTLGAAVTATAHKLARMSYGLVKHGVDEGRERERVVANLRNGPED
jgi:hypothetical protein